MLGRCRTYRRGEQHPFLEQQRERDAFNEERRLALSGAGDAGQQGPAGPAAATDPRALRCEILQERLAREAERAFLFRARVVQLERDLATARREIRALRENQRASRAGSEGADQCRGDP